MTTDPTGADPRMAAASEFLDFPTAWAIQNEVGPTLDHDPHCSSVPGWHVLSGPGLLCDCGAVRREWKRRRARHPADAATNGGE
jgi:hypothetical protein